MSRYINSVETIFSKDEIDGLVEQLLVKDGFKRKNVDGEEIWMKKGFLKKSQMIIVHTKNGKAEIQAWIKPEIFPGIYYGEINLDVDKRIPVKQELKKRIARLEQNIKNQK